MDVREKKNIIYEEDGVPILENSLGCRLVPYKEGQYFGLGSFYMNGKKLGGVVTYFVAEETADKTYRASKYKIIENSPEKGVIRFSGKDGKLEFHVTITLLNNSPGYKISYEFDPIHPIYHPLYINVPFKSSFMTFVKYPYEDTLRPGFNDRWVIISDRGRVPFIFGCENIDGEAFFVGVGYCLTEDFVKGTFIGRIEFDPIKYPETSLKIYTPYHGMARPINLQCVTRLELLRHINLGEESKKIKRTLEIVVSTAKNQYDCVKGYIDQSGYDLSISAYRSIDDAVAALISVYKNTPGYIKGKGYYQLIRFDTGDYDTTLPHGWYSKYIITGSQMQLAYQLYKYWEDHQHETWAKERATEIADFVVKENKGIFLTIDADTGGTSVIHPYNIEGTPFKEYIYSMKSMSAGALYLYKLYLEMKRFEGVDRTDWKNVTIKTMEHIINLMGPNGELGRNYNERGEYDKATSGLGLVLLALNHIYNETLDEKFKTARDKLEKWLYDQFIRLNDWCNASGDAGAWQGEGWPPPHNNDCMGALTFATYCVYRYIETREEKYLQMAKDAVAYYWLATVPVQFPGYKYVTRGLQREQDFYSCFDVPFKSDEIIDCLPLLSKITGELFFIKLYRLLIQTQLHYQAIDKPYPAFYIGLESDETGREPADKIAEENVAYIVKFASTFLDSVNSPYAYRYVGNEKEGVGLDYNITFSLNPNAPYILSASTMVRDISWDEKNKILSIVLYDKNKKEGILDILWKPEIYSISETKIEIDGKILNASKFYNPKDKIISVHYKHEYPIKIIRLYCKDVSNQKEN